MVIFNPISCRGIRSSIYRNIYLCFFSLSFSNSSIYASERDNKHPSSSKWNNLSGTTPGGGILPNNRLMGVYHRMAGADPGAVKWVNFHPPPPPFSEPLFNHADAQTSNTSTRLWFYYIIAKIHPPPPFQNSGSAIRAWMGSHFHDWLDYDGVVIFNRVTRMRSHIFGILGS